MAYTINNRPKEEKYRKKFQFNSLAATTFSRSSRTSMGASLSSGVVPLRSSSWKCGTDDDDDDCIGGGSFIRTTLYCVCVLW